MTTTTAPQLSLTRIVNAPRALVYKAFTDPDQFASWWGPFGNALPRDQVEFDLRPGGYQKWHEIFPGKPDTWTDGRFDLTDIVDGELLEGTMRITGELPGDFKPFETQDAHRVPRRDRWTDATRGPPVASRPSRVPDDQRLGRGVRQARQDARRLRQANAGA